MIKPALLVTLFILITWLSSSEGAGNPIDCGITGNWTDQFGYTMDLTCQPGSSLNDLGSLNGKYFFTGTSVSLSGRYLMIGNDCIFGFSVVLESATGFANATSWTGTHFSNEDSMNMHWILSKHTEKADLWKNTHIGSAVFTKTGKGGQGGTVIG